MNTSEWGPRVPSLMFEKRRLNVLLVDHEPNVHASIVGMLEHHFHKGTIHISHKFNFICSFGMHHIYMFEGIDVSFFFSQEN